jgi:hypothetical protein
MIMKTKLSPSVAAVRPRALVGASLPGGVTCAAGIHRVNGTSVSVDGMDGFGIRPTYVPTQALPVGGRAWSPPD